MKLPDLSHEIQLWSQGYTIIGIDEVGRGAFAGPVYVAGVIFEPTKDDKQIRRLLSHGINDSKKLTAKKRQDLSKIIKKEAHSFKISFKSVSEINRIGVGKAAFSAMREAVYSLVKEAKFKPYILVDGFNIKYIKGIGLQKQKAIIGGDGISLSIAAASIIAKVERDEHMTELSKTNSNYFWDRNKGYGTNAHREAITRLGVCNHHRKAFVKNFIQAF